MWPVLFPAQRSTPKVVGPGIKLATHGEVMYKRSTKRPFGRDVLSSHKNDGNEKRERHLTIPNRFPIMIRGTATSPEVSSHAFRAFCWE